MALLHTEITISATPEKVWSVFSDFASYPEWNPFVIRLEGEVAPGNTIAIQLQPPNGKQMGFRPKVLKYEAAKELRWKGRLLMPGIFDGEHFFQLEALPDGSTKFIQGEKFSGMLVPFLKKMLTDTGQGFNSLNQALKKRVEAAL